MKKMVFLIVFVITLTVPCTAQELHLLTQADVDGTNLDGYAGINLTIGPDSCCSDIHDLSPLANLVGVYYGKLVIQNNPHLKSLHGLEKCKTLGFFPLLEITNNDSLLDLEGLAPKLFIDADPWDRHLVSISGNDMLESLHGFPELDKGWATISFTHNNNLKSFAGLENQQRIADLYVHSLPRLMSLDGLGQTDSIGSIIMANCPRLKNFEGLGNLAYLSTGRFSRLDSLETTSGLGEIRALGDLQIQDCPKLQNLEGFKKVGGKVQYLWLQHCHRLGDFSGWSDSCTVGKFTYYDNDSITEFVDLHHVHALKSDIHTCENLKYLHSLPIGVKDTIFWTESPYLFISECPNLEFLHHPDSLAQPDEWEYFWSLNNTKLNDISGLSFIKKITGLFAISNSNLQNLNGMENIRNVYSLSLRDNLNLSELSALTNLEYCDDISYGNNGSQNLNGLNNLKEVSRIGISYDFVLNDLSSLFNPLLKIKNWISIVNLPLIDTIYGFENIKNIGTPESFGQISIWSMPNLKSIKGFSQMDSIKYRNLSTPKISLLIFNNPELESITGFQNLKYLGAGFQIYNNPKLKDVSGLCPLFKYGHLSPDYNLLQGNGSGMNSLSQIRMGCDTILDAATAISIKSNINIYPNPASGLVTIDFMESDWDDIALVSIMGGTVYQLKNINRTSKIEINLDNFQNGYYLVRVSKGNRIIDTKKLIIIKGQ